MMVRKTALAAFLVVDLVLLGLIVALFPQFRTAFDGGNELSGAAWFDEPLALPDFSLVDQDGDATGLADLSGRWQLLFFGFTSCPDVCPLTMQGLASFYRSLEPELQAETGVVMVTVDPLRDSPAVMKQFLARFDERFMGLTGEYPQLESLAASLFVSFTPPQRHDAGHGAHTDYLVQHSDYVAVIDPNGGYRGVIHAPHTRERLTELYLSLRR